MRFHFEGILSFIKKGLEFMAADVKNNEYAKLTTAERVGYGLGDFAQNLVFGTVGGFLAVYMLQINAIMGLAFKFGITIASFAMTVIGVFGYKSGATVQTAAAQQGINVAMVWIPIVLALIAMFVMARYPLTEMAVKENNEKLDARRANIIDSEL